MQETLTELL